MSNVCIFYFKKHFAIFDASLQNLIEIFKEKFKCLFEYVMPIDTTKVQIFRFELPTSNLKGNLMPDQQMVVVDSQDSVKTNAVN